MAVAAYSNSHLRPLIAAVDWNSHYRKEGAVKLTSITNTTTGSENAIVGIAENGIGVHGTSKTSTGAGGVSDTGIGVHGVSPGGPGVRGDAEHGVGVYGASKSSTGTGGVSDTGVGVHGISSKADGVFGSSDTGRGVVGVTKGGSVGVEGGATATGTGVYGSSTSGIGVHGKGGRLGGYFEGAVEITGNLTIQGVSIQTWGQRVIRLEQLVAQLQQQLSAISQGKIPVVGPGASAFINAVVTPTPNGNQLEISGSGFQGNEMVSVLISRTRDGQPADAANYDVQANHGSLDYKVGVICQINVQQVWTVQASGKTSKIVSNTATATC